MQISDTEFPEVKLISNFCSQDTRGRFIKIYNEDIFAESGLRTDFAESYYSVSAKGTIRGLHFQTPPYDHAKLVHVIAGAAVDVVVDLRRDSGSYGKHIDIRFTSDKPQALYIPSGFAHGFHSLADNTTVIYYVTSGYSREHDAGVRWDSIEFDWKEQNPIVSERDSGFPALSEYESPF